MYIFSRHVLVEFSSISEHL